MNKKTTNLPINETTESEHPVQGEQLDLLDGFFDNDRPKVSPMANTPNVATFPQPTEETSILPETSSVTPKKETKELLHEGTDGVLYTNAEWESPVIHDGPSRKEVEGWKARYTHVYFTPFDGEVFVWRTLQRPEYREIIREATLTALDREEMFTEKCVLFPYDFSLEKIKKSRAGIASLLSEMIMDKSGFVAQSAPIKL